MKLVLACIAVVLLAAEVELQRSKRPRKNSVVQAFTDAGIVPDVMPTAPEELLGVCYGDVEINLGNEIFAGDGIELPTLECDVVEPGCLYTVIIIDISVPCKETPTWRSYLMGMWMNVDDNMDLESSCEIAKYVAPSPIPGTGPHTYVIILYKQAEEIDVTDENITRYQKDRLSFCVADFAAYNSLCPVAGNFYTSEFRCPYMKSSFNRG
ncbi:protein D1-like [Maniola hyperantus]|uniref:protein D1-like n=1 Tax=Aphantopus hyperantus TaxID=2795564 RepID=UPI001569F08A|nr:protein D1-like [Maniola hyperantus]